MDLSKQDFSFSSLPTSSQWKTIGQRHHHGIALSLSSLRDPTNAGIGEFLNLIPLIEWSRSVGFDVIQLLPLNDSGKDPSPYSAHSATALHPIYLSLSELPVLELFPELVDELEKIRYCNASQNVKYHQVLQNKEQFLKKYLSKSASFIRSWPGFTAFMKANPWLEGYALYKTLKTVYEEKPWWEWPSSIRDPTPELLTSLKGQYHQEIQHHLYTQFLCFDQWEKVRKVADTEGLFLKGDIPILINRDSADVWLHRELFLLDYSAGAPPDMYSEEGQNWGFPLYNWNELEKTGYEWWKTRLQVAEKLYHIYRIDHIVGFFKIWAIPHGKSAKEGFFLPQDESLWIPQGEKILRMMIDSCHMLPIGEDLGAVPPLVRATLQQLGICGTKVLRWERRWNEDQSFIDPREFSLLSMSCLSTHDSETLAEWWNTFQNESQRLADSKGWPFITPLRDSDRKLLLEECHTSGSLFHINLLQEYLGVFEELRWEDPEDERINIPGLVLDRNWTYRFRPTLEEIITHKPLAELMRSLST